MSWLTKETVALLWQGIILTLVLTAVTSVAALIIGVGTGVARLSGKGFWRRAAVIHIELHRNIPALVLIIFWAFALPNLFPPALRQTIFFDNFFVNALSDLTGLSVPYYALAAAFGLTLNTSAYLAELFRAGVGTIPREHIDAARSLGASPVVTLRNILIPEGIRASFPAMSTRLIHNMKNTALAAFVSVPEFFHGIETAITRSFRAVEFLLLAAGIYLLLSYGYSLLLTAVEQRMTRRQVSAVFKPEKGWQPRRV
ncbi:MAG: amino acid ABC transporter permease [Candidatus Promineifilaceae bacterium]